MSIQKVIERIRIASSFWVPVFVFLLPLGLMVLSGILNHNYATRVATELGLDSTRIKAAGFFILATGSLLFSYPFVLSHFKMDNTLDPAEKKMLSILLLVAITPYSVLILFDAFNKYKQGTLSNVSTLFDIAQVVIAMGFEYAAGILALPIRKLMFSDVANKGGGGSSSSKSVGIDANKTYGGGSGSNSGQGGDNKQNPPVAPKSGPT